MSDGSLIQIYLFACTLLSLVFFLLWLIQMKKNQKLQIRYLEVKVQLQERQLSFERETQQYEQQKQQLSEHFQRLSEEIFSAKSGHLEQQNQKTLQHILQPFNNQLNSFKQEVQAIHHRESVQHGQLRQELNQLKQLNQKITQEAQQLSQALRGTNKLQGNWGEMVLESVLTRAGLQEGQQYRREVSFNSDQGRKRPDVIVYLPDNKHIIIDAKVSLTDYVNMVNADDKESYQLAAKQHTHSIKQHIKTLAEKQYPQLKQLNTPEWLVLFIPIESAFADAVRYDEQLFDYALQQKILIATPSTLLSSLQIVAQIWRYQEQNTHLSEVVSKAESIHKKLNSFLTSFERISRSLTQAQDAYRQAENQLVAGRGNLLKQVNDFKKIAPNIHNDLSSSLLEKAELERDKPK